MGSRKQGGFLTHEQPEAKRQRTDNFNASTEEVNVVPKRCNHEGIVRTVTYTSKIATQSIKDIKRRIEKEEEIRFEAKRFDLYPAFSEALLRLLGKIEEILADENNPTKILLIHGVPTIGKTSLAECLSYFLALSAEKQESVHYIQLSHSAKMDNNVLTMSIVAEARCNKYVIVDQVNINTLQRAEITRCIENRLEVANSRMPLVLFTSGHCTPSEKWLNLQNTGFLCYKLITMKIDMALINKLRKLKAVPKGDGIMSSGDILKLTTSYSAMHSCLMHIRFEQAKIQRDELRNIIFPKADLERIRDESVRHFVWMAWQDLISKGIPTLDSFSDDDCKMNPHHVQYLGYLISRIKDTTDLGVNAILNLMDIDGRKHYERNGYSEFKPDEYCYKFLHKESLHDVLVAVANDVANAGPETRYKMLLSAFNHMTKEDDSHYQYLRGGLFELIIVAICDKTREARGSPVGMVGIDNSVEFGLVNKCETVATELELCALPGKYAETKERKMTFWCVLNVKGRPSFKGFDFAYLVTKPILGKPVVSKLQLFQVTVNPGGKTLDTKRGMTDVLNDVKAELVAQNLIERSCPDIDAVVVPYFVHPFPENGQITLPYRDSDESITAEILGFPQDFLKLKVT